MELYQENELLENELLEIEEETSGEEYLLAKAAALGYVSYDDILTAFPYVEENLEELEDILATLVEASIERIAWLVPFSRDACLVAGLLEEEGERNRVSVIVRLSMGLPCQQACSRHDAHGVDQCVREPCSPSGKSVERRGIKVTPKAPEVGVSKVVGDDEKNVRQFADRWSGDLRVCVRGDAGLKAIPTER